jgi:hypothetical protein
MIGCRSSNPLCPLFALRMQVDMVLCTVFDFLPPLLASIRHLWVSAQATASNSDLLHDTYCHQ